jgi:hypothetical protein
LIDWFFLFNCELCSSEEEGGRGLLREDGKIFFSIFVPKTKSKKKVTPKSPDFLIYLPELVSQLS